MAGKVVLGTWLRILHLGGKVLKIRHRRERRFCDCGEDKRAVGVLGRVVGEGWEEVLIRGSEGEGGVYGRVVLL